MITSNLIAALLIRTAWWFIDTQDDTYTGKTDLKEIEDNIWDICWDLSHQKGKNYYPKVCQLAGTLATLFERKYNI